jgi:hypothetical protein
MFSFEFSRQRILALGAVTLMVATLLPAPVVRAQSADAEAVPAAVEVPVVLSGDATSHPSTPTYHILRARTEAGKHAALNGPDAQSRTEAAARINLAGLARPGFFPADLSFFGGSVLSQGNSLNVYYNCADSSCFGNPEQFQTDLAKSKFIHVVDQYVGSKANNRYPLSTTPPVHINGTSTSLSFNDIVNMVASADVFSGAGPGHIFHIFLPQGVDTCLDPGNTVCYSPDNPSTWVFCAYHADAIINGADVFYTVLPYANVDGCNLAPPNPNSALIDSTNSVLSHELFETISDPLGDAWLANSSFAEQGNEIGDICTGAGNASGQEIDPSYVLVKGRTYQTQLEYSNARHGCVVAP